MIERSAFYTDEQWARFMIATEGMETPCIVVDLGIVKANYERLAKLFPFARQYYAVKANPAPEVLILLRELGANFDIASRWELDKVLALGVHPDRLSYGNTIKKARDVEYFYSKGVRSFATDSKTDLFNIAAKAPGSRVYLRILVEGSQSADWPLSRKFGCHPDMAYNLLVEAKRLGLVPWGISFHVGSQQRDIGQWDEAIAKTNYLFRAMEEEEGIVLGMINMGGGFPAHYTTPAHELEIYAKEITRYLHEDFGEQLPDIILEPGRSMVGDAGIIVSEVVLVSRKNNTALQRWVYTDVGKFNGLIETLDESIKYPVVTDHEASVKEGDVILAGPTCDSMDIMYERSGYQLPLNLVAGDRLYWLSAGAYTSSYASVEFNGFPPIKTVFIEP
ncbi:MAG TPA: ornithine decarboxylase [Treponema sp.]|nr:MAG: ornithine decarboxylase [Treponema sp. GWC1_61_84]HCM27007.1 ornithine decarboxylase [Treponema sp.]